MESDDFNHLGPTSDQHQFSPNNIRITKLITKGECFNFKPNSLHCS